MKILNHDRHYEIIADMAAYDKDDIKVVFENNTVKIAARKEQDNDDYGHCQLRTTKQICLQDVSAVESAKFEDGLLKIKVLKSSNQVIEVE